MGVVKAVTMVGVVNTTVDVVLERVKSGSHGILGVAMPWRRAQRQTILHKTKKYTAVI